MERGKKNPGRWRLRHAATLATLATLVGFGPGAGDARALSTAQSMPGEVLVSFGYHQTHTVLIRDAVKNLEPDRVFFGAALGLGAATAAQEGTAAVAGGAAAPELAVLVLALAWIAERLRRGERIEVQPTYVVLITDFNGPISADPPGCRQQVRGEDPNIAYLPNTVECDVLPRVDPDAEGSAPWLLVSGADLVDKVKLDIGCGFCWERKLVYGGADDDILTGSESKDELVGEDGNDWLYGLGGDDWIMGRHSHTDLEAALDDPSYPGSLPDNDRLFGGAGADVILGYRGDDLIVGGDDSDNRVVTYEQPSVMNPPNSRLPATTEIGLNGGAGNDIIVGGTGTDKMEGGSDRDLLLAKESDFGKLDQADDVDCGPNYVRPVGAPEQYRASRFPNGSLQDLVEDTCSEWLSSAPSAEALWKWKPGSPWPR